MTTVPPPCTKSREYIWASPSLATANKHFVNKVQNMSKAEKNGIKKAYVYSIQPNECHYHDLYPHLNNCMEGHNCPMFFKKKGYAFFTNCKEIVFDYKAHEAAFRSKEFA